MNKNVKIYLAGSVPKGDKEAKDFFDWRSDYKKQIEKYINKVDFIDPYERGEFNESDFMAVFGADCYHIKNSDLIAVNAEDKLGVGTAQELVIAKYFKKPVITVLPKGTHHRRIDIMFRGQLIADWIHPFLFAFSDLILESISEFNLTNVDLDKMSVKDIKVIDRAVDIMGKKYEKR